MTPLDVTVIALGAVVTMFLAEHLAVWSLFWKRGWRVSVAAPKPASSQGPAAAPAAAEAGDSPAVVTAPIRPVGGTAA